MKEKIRFTAKLIFMSWAIVNIFIVVAIVFEKTPIENYFQTFYVTIYVMGPLAGSAVLAILISEISDKRRLKNVQKNREDNPANVSENPV